LAKYYYGDGKATWVLRLDRNLIRDKGALTLEAEKALLGTAISLLVEHNFFRNLEYVGIYGISSSRRMLILTWEKVSLILSIYTWSFLPFHRFEEGDIGF